MIPLAYNVRSLAVRRTTTVATALGIGLVVFVLASALMLSAGIRRTLGSSGRKDQAIVLRKGSDAELSSSIELQQVGLILAAPGVQHADSAQRSGAPSTGTPAGGAQAPLGAGELVVLVTQDKEGQEGAVSNVQVRGIVPESLALRPELRVVAGRQARPGSDEVLIGQRLVGRFRGMALGQSFDLRKNRPVQVVGVFECGGTSYESEVWADADTVRGSFGREGLVSSVRVRLESAEKFDAFEAAVEQDKRLGLDAVREDVFYEKLSEGTTIFVTAMGLMIAVFFSVGAMIGAMITMYASIASRQREVGTLRALGFSRSAILLAFLLEALLLSLLGGVVGIAGALCMGMVKFSMMNFASWSEVVFSFTPTPGILLGALAFAAGMGLLGGLFPAVRAARISPVRAMRE